MSKINDIVKKEFPKIDEDETISKIISKMKDSEAIIVLKDDKYKGVLNKRDISKAKISPNTKVKTFVSNVAKLNKGEKVQTTAGLMLESNSYMLPVFDKDKLIGVVTALDLLKKAVDSDFGEQTIKNFVSTPVIKIDSDEPVGKAIKIFKEQDISRLPVYEKNSLLGLLTLDDTITRFIHPEHRPGGSGQYEDTSKYGAYMSDKKESLDLPVKGVMSENVVIMHPEDNIKNVVNSMMKHNYRGMLIGKDNNVLGVVTKRDLLEPLATSEILEPIVIQFSGELEKINDFNKQRPREIIYSNFKKHMEYLDNAHVYVRLKRHTEQSKGKHIIFCKMRLSSPRGMFIASEEGWGFMDAVNKSIEAIEKQIRRDKGR